MRARSWPSTQAVRMSRASSRFADSKVNGNQLRREPTPQDREVDAMNRLARNSALLAAVLSTGWACSAVNEPVDIGDCYTGEHLEDYAAEWEGYAEAYNFADGSDKVRLKLDASGNGTLEIGNSPALPIATDPNVGYPASYKSDSSFEQFTYLFPGFAYAVDTATVESARIRFTLNPWQIARDWCEMQTPYDIHSQDSGGVGGMGG